MHLTEEQLKAFLVDPGHLSAEQFDAAVKNARHGGVPFDRFIVESGLMENERVGQAIADGLGYRYVELSKLRIPDGTLALLGDVAMHAQEAVIFDASTERLKIATAKPENKEFFRQLEVEHGKKVDVYYTTPAEIAEVLHYYQSALREKVRTLLESVANAPADTGNIVALLDSLIEYAHDSRASDVHIEPLAHEVSVRFRVDGVLHEVARYPKAAHEHLVSRIKIVARLHIDEHATPQDGRFDFHHDAVDFDVRVSIVPVTNGENVVLRLLEPHQRRISRLELGMTEHDFEKISRAIERPYGMILSVGPTGSGKTTTIYFLLEMLNTPEVNIMTIEDPVEYNIDRVQQIQVNPDKEVHFATGLRSIVRQDPDIIMVGEIRDSETADIAVNAAMTGHLLLSTMHTNDAATVFPRLVEMGVEPFLSASSLVVIIAQRLVRKICEKCRSSYVMTAEEAALLHVDEEFSAILSVASGKGSATAVTFYRGTGCASCGNTGYVGRIGIFEVMEISETLRTLIIANTHADQIAQAARTSGMTSMLADGVHKALAGTTTIAEVIRVIRS